MDKENILQSEKSIVNFENIPVRRVWDTEKEQWFFAIVDVVAVCRKVPIRLAILKICVVGIRSYQQDGANCHPLYIKTKGGEQKLIVLMLKVF